MKERAHEDQGWLLTRRFETAASAVEVYEKARDLLLAEDLDASVFRIMFRGTSYVAMVGEIALENAARDSVLEVLNVGDEADVPFDVAELLRERRRRFKATELEFLERRTLPNE
jgi:hypothetical protein